MVKSWLLLLCSSDRVTLLWPILYICESTVIAIERTCLSSLRYLQPKEEVLRTMCGVEKVLRKFLLVLFALQSLPPLDCYGDIQWTPKTAILFLHALLWTRLPLSLLLCEMWLTPLSRWHCAFLIVPETMPGDRIQVGQPLSGAVGLSKLPVVTPQRRFRRQSGSRASA